MYQFLNQNENFLVFWCYGLLYKKFQGNILHGSGDG